MGRADQRARLQYIETSNKIYNFDLCYCGLDGARLFKCVKHMNSK